MEKDRTRPPDEDLPDLFPQDFSPGGSAMAQLIRDFDWSKTAIGAIEGWSAALRMQVNFMIANRFPILLWWGPDYISIYNDAYAPILGARHPSALGKPFRDVWPEISHVLLPLIDAPFRGERATWMEDILLEIRRYGWSEETHFTIAYSPVPDHKAPRGIGGVVATVHEITGKVVGERRLGALRDLGTQSGRTMDEACALCTAVLKDHAADIPFALLYRMDKDGKTAILAGSSGFGGDHIAAPGMIEPGAQNAVWPLAAAQQGPVTVERLAETFPGLPTGPWSNPPHTAVILPLRTSATDPAASG